uniref:Lactate/malate dehydrogenase N-terminal domain-containing protein n=1 Tax=Strix occidentalis caurina TaxID=311401 RepID=A0A8D0ENX9_STROC
MKEPFYGFFFFLAKKTLEKLICQPHLDVFRSPLCNLGQTADCLLCLPTMKWESSSVGELCLTDFSASADSKVVVLTVNSLGNAQTYLDVIQSNVDLFRGIIPAISHYSQNTVLLVASHPVEVMTFVSWKLSAFPKSRVIGVGANLDTERFQYLQIKQKQWLLVTQEKRWLTGNAIIILRVFSSCLCT